MTNVSLWNQFLQTIEPYAVMFTIALFSVGTMAVYTWGRQRGFQGQLDQLAKGAGGRAPAPNVTVTVPQQNPVAAGRTPLLAPPWNQLDDALPDGMQDPYRTVDCGEECVSMAVAASSGPNLPAYIFRTLLGSGAGQSGTTAPQLVYLLHLFGLAAHARQADSDSAWIEWQHSYTAGFLVIALGYWVDLGYPHWVLIRETDDGLITFNDPWGGIVRSMSKAVAQKCYLGTYVHLDAKVSGLAASPPRAA